jgi:hypothetical protein
LILFYFYLFDFWLCPALVRSGCIDRTEKQQNKNQFPNENVKAIHRVRNWWAAINMVVWPC